MTQKISKILSGVSGEYFVAAELSRHGHIASITLRNTRGVDILASNEAGSCAVAIQVKTNQGSVKEWILSKGAETNIADNLFYVFVNLKGLNGTPEYHVVQSAIVADYCAKVHQQWLAEPRKDGTPHKDNPIRVFRDSECVYRDVWKSLELD